MLDIKLIRENPDIIRKDLKKREAPELLKELDRCIELDREWRSVKKEVEDLKHKRNVLSREVAQLKKAGKDARAQLDEVKSIPDKIKTLDEKHDKLLKDIRKIQLIIPNILHESVPVGADDEENVMERTWGEKPKFDFPLKSHVDILLEKDLADTEKAGEVSGSRFYYLKGPLVLMNLALKRLAIDHLFKKGFLPVEPPFMLRRKPYEGVTSLDDFEDVMYKIDGEDLYLIATSEHPLGVYHMNEVLDAAKLPLKYAGISTCFRKEAGSHGKDTKGIFRVHHFDKIEQFVYCRPEDSWKIHDELIKNAEELFQMLGIHYRIVNICTGDIGTIAAKKYDLETWMPSQGKYREAVSCSNCTDYQARRLNVKYQDGEKRELVHTLNSTAFATSRVIVAILENYQNADGSITVHEVLRPYMNGIEKIE